MERMKNLVIYPTCEEFPLDWYDMVEVNVLLPQLAEKAESLTKSRLFEIAKTPAMLFVARDRERRRVDQKDSIVAMTLFIRLVTTTVRFGLVEDVVTDEQYRRRGIGEMLTKCVIDNGTLLNLNYIDLHSSNWREAAHGMYKKCGFKVVASGPERTYFRYTYK
jgi:ribosomal protein S18 acetylase RimI-like enzyme